mgnify:CR=1 FL=1
MVMRLSRVFGGAQSTVERMQPKIFESRQIALREVFNLVLESKGNIIRLLKFPEAVAEKFEQISPAYCFALAKVYDVWLEEHAPRYKNTFGAAQVPKVTQDEWNAMSDEDKADFKQKVAAAKEKGAAHAQKQAASDLEVVSSEENFTQYMNETGGALTKLFKKNPELSKKFNNIKDIEEVHQIFAELQKDEPADGKTLIKFSNGYFWVLLTDVEHSAEAKLMQHCATDHRGKLVSLRDPQNHPHVTMTWSEEKKTVYQIKGKQNKAPDKKYWPSIEDFFKKFKPKLRDSFINQQASELATVLAKYGPAPEDRNGIHTRLKSLGAKPAVQAFIWPSNVESFIPQNQRNQIDWDEKQELQQELGQVMGTMGFQETRISHKSINASFFFHKEAWKTPVKTPPPAHLRDHWYTFGAAMIWRNQEGLGNVDVLRDPTKFYEQHRAELESFWQHLCEFLKLPQVPLQTVLDQKVGKFTGY